MLFTPSKDEPPAAQSPAPSAVAEVEVHLFLEIVLLITLGEQPEAKIPAPK
jgi:hypothetical protein